MFKFLVVGCGGSGGSTLAFMMDQLRSDLAAHGISELPVGWQFVHIDVPNAPDTRIAGIGNVVDQGGSYISTGPQSGNYAVLDNGLSQMLGNGGPLGEIGTWAPRDPQRVTVPIGNGAGQMRAVGRAITLSRTSAVHDGLERAVSALSTVEANTSMAEVQARFPGIGPFSNSSRPVVLVVSSMAGGAGASMALDVCRLLAMIPGVDPGLTGVFMLTPGVFDSLPETARGGVSPNALAMLGEVVAAQTGAADDHDATLLAALGRRSGGHSDAPFARVFPVGRLVGAERVLFGNGSPDAVYRGLGRGLAALMCADSASNQFVTFDLGNESDPSPADLDTLGWGSDANRIPWGAFGFASLSMGRDRYRHYAAQRLARGAADRLRSGHIQPGNPASGTDQIKALVDNGWSDTMTALGLPTAGVLNVEQVVRWLTETAFPRSEAEMLAADIADEHLTPFVPNAIGPGAQWLQALRQFVTQRKAPLSLHADDAAYRWAFTWAAGLHDRIVDEIDAATALFGLPYARAVLARVETTIAEQLLEGLAFLARSGPDLGRVPPKLEDEVTAIRGTIAGGHGLVDHFVTSHRGSITDSLYSRSAGLLRDVLHSLVVDVLGPLRESISEALAVLETAAVTAPTASSLANVATPYYTAWPAEDDVEVASRFGVADNEILLTPAASFDDQFRVDLPTALGGGARNLTYIEAWDRSVRLTLEGSWPVAAGGEAPGGLVEVLAPWRPVTFTKHPFTDERLTPSRARFVVRASPAELVGRTSAYVRRPGESFETFCTLSLRDYASGADVLPSQMPARHADIVAKFSQALSRALPLVSINGDAVLAIHKQPMAYRFKFSAVPFKRIPALAEALGRVIGRTPNMAEEVAGVFDEALGDHDGVTKIDLFGSYRNYSPLVFDSLLEPVAKQWARTPAHGRGDFWSNRRARPLPASLPMSAPERQAMVAGWYVGQITGAIRLPASPYTAPVQIWDDRDRTWLSFPNPLLTPPASFIGKSIDWLPAVMESVLLAIAHSHDAPVLSALRPYTVLRGLFDSTSQRPISGLADLGAEVSLAAWLGTGTTASGDPSRTTGGTAEERHDSAVAWLEQIHDFAATHFVSPTSGAGGSGGGKMSVITNRSQASQTPIFRDLAVDIVCATERLQGVLDRALVRSRQVPLGTRASAPGASLTPEPDFGPF